MRQGSVLAAVVIGASLVVAAIAFALVDDLLRRAGSTETEAAVARLSRQVEAQSAEVAALQATVEAVQRRQEAVEERLAAPGATQAEAGTDALPPLPVDQFGGSAAPADNEGLVDPMELAKGRFNQGVARPTPAVLRDLLGEPRTSYGDACQPVTGAKLLRALDTRVVGSFKLTMLRPALDSFVAVMRRLEANEPELYRALGTAGALCARHVRGAPGTVSSHAWGAAVDLTLTGDLDAMGDGATQFGLVVLAEYFNEAGWYWGAGYGREDSMHFEAGESLLRAWAADGLI